jgi:hypothetical protein
MDRTLRERQGTVIPTPPEASGPGVESDAARKLAPEAVPALDRLVVAENWMAAALFGERNANLKRVERETGA